jgi:hypothetical protein
LRRPRARIIESLTWKDPRSRRRQSSPEFRVTAARDQTRPIAGTDACEVGENEVARIDPGHDAWVVGDEPCTVVDFGASPSYAKQAAAAQEPGMG